MSWTASSAERVFECSASDCLPQGDSTNRWAERGDVVDGYVRQVLTGTPVAKALEAIDDKAVRETCRNIDWKTLIGDLHDIRVQVPYAIDFRARTARELVVDGHRKYPPLGEYERAGTDDIEGLSFIDVPVIPDVKSGYQRVTKCRENRQMMFYAGAKMLVTGATEVEGRIAYVRANGSVQLDSHPFTRFEIDTFLDEMEEAIDRTREEGRVYLAGGPVHVSTGPWCKYCRAMSWCPEKTRLAQAMLNDATELSVGAMTKEEAVRRVSEMTLEQAGRAFAKGKEIGHLLEPIMEALKLRSHNEWLPTDPGKVARPISYEQDRFDQGEAIELLHALGATDDQIGALYKPHVVEKVQVTNDPRIPKVKAPRKPRKSKDQAA